MPIRLTAPVKASPAKEAEVAAEAEAQRQPSSLLGVEVRRGARLDEMESSDRADRSPELRRLSVPTDAA